MIGIEINGNFKAYHFVELAQLNSPLKDVLVSQKIILEFNLETLNGIFRNPKWEVLLSTNALWFTRYTFHL